MSTLYEAVDQRHRTLYVPAPTFAETLQQPGQHTSSGQHLGPHSGQHSDQRPGSAAEIHPSDPPIYRALLLRWADQGRTLPGHRDPEWARLTAPLVRPGQFSATRDPRGGGR
ncbi:hypothetical protein ACX6XY_23790 [Streptomyces sp. O3]